MPWSHSAIQWCTASSASSILPTAEFSLAWTEKEVLKHIRTEDKRRASYYRYYTGEEWRDAAGYDLCLDSDALGEDGCVERISKVLPLYSK